MRDAFKETKFLTDPQLIHDKYTFGLDQLQMLQRQVRPRPICILKLVGTRFLFASSPDPAKSDVYATEISCGKN